MSVIDHVLNPPGSWHRPIMLSVNVTINRVTLDNAFTVRDDLISWYKVTPENYVDYRVRLNELLNDIMIPSHISQCKNLLCNNKAHNVAINTYCDAIIDSCIKAGKETLPKSKIKSFNKPFWNEFVKPHRECALLWGQIWHDCGEPLDGIVSSIYKKVKREYHYAVRYVNQHDKQLRKQRMTQCLLTNNNRDFWDENRKINHTSTCMPTYIDDAHTTSSIAANFAKKYKDIYNSVPSDPIQLAEIRSVLNYRILRSASNDHIVTTNEVTNAASKLKANKTDGNNKLWANHIKYGSTELHKHISNLLTFMYTHGTNPREILIATIVSIPKDKQGRMCDSTNYRGIAMISALAKINDLIILNQYPQQLQTSNLQFAYKTGHSTVMCSSILKEVVNHYIKNNSRVYCCMLDASKAFDRLRYDKLFTMLVERGLPPVIIRLLLDLYTNQMSRARWGDSHSGYFNVQNGIRQGGILSPILYSIYQDELIRRLEVSGEGCYVGHEYFGILSYADDVALLCPSVTGLQKMIDTSVAYGVEFDIKYNKLKSEAICFANEKMMPTFNVYMDDQILTCKCFVKHLGIKINHNLDDKEDILLKRGQFIGKTNLILSKYKGLGGFLMSKMIDTYCCDFYGCEAWNFNNGHFKQLLTSWNISMRQAWHLPFNTHTYVLRALAGLNPRARMYNKFLTMLNTFKFTRNKKIFYLYRYCQANMDSRLCKNEFLIRKQLAGVEILTDDQEYCVGSITELLETDFMNISERNTLINYFATLDV